MYHKQNIARIKKRKVTDDFTPYDIGWEIVEDIPYDDFRADGFEKHAPFDGIAFSKNIAEIEGESHLQYVADTDITNFDIMTGLEKLKESKDKKRASEEELASVRDEYTVLLEAHTHNAEDIDKKYNTTVNEINAQKVTLQSQYYAIDASIKEKENASDICPTT